MLYYLSDYMRCMSLPFLDHHALHASALTWAVLPSTRWIWKHQLMLLQTIFHSCVSRKSIRTLKNIRILMKKKCTEIIIPPIQNFKCKKPCPWKMQTKTHSGLYSIWKKIGQAKDWKLIWNWDILVRGFHILRSLQGRRPPTLEGSHKDKGHSQQTRYLWGL